jgi:hypothetical protein
MTALSALEAFDIIRFGSQLGERLDQARAELEGKRGHEREKGWMATAEELVAEVLKDAPALLERARSLPELADTRAELAEVEQGHWVDALEKVLAGITFHAGSRAPLIEALFPHQKFPALRRATREQVQQYGTELERRLKTGYVTRMFGQDEYAFIRPVVENVSRAYLGWKAVFETPSLGEEEARPLRAELVAQGTTLDLALQQARLLAQAALVPLDGAFEAAGLAARPKRRTRTSSDVVEVQEEVPSEDAAPVEAPEPGVEAPAEVAAPSEPLPLESPPVPPEAAEPEARPAKAPRKRAKAAVEATPPPTEPGQ